MAAPRRLLSGRQRRMSSGLVSGCCDPGGSSLIPTFLPWEGSETQSPGQGLHPSFLLVHTLLSPCTRAATSLAQGTFLPGAWGGSRLERCWGLNPGQNGFFPDLLFS